MCSSYDTAQNSYTCLTQHLVSHRWTGGWHVVTPCREPQNDTTSPSEDTGKAEKTLFKKVSRISLLIDSQSEPFNTL